MKSFKIIGVLALVATLSACGGKISSNIVTDAVQAQASTAPVSANATQATTSPKIVTDLQSAEFNLDNAVTVGALSANDPAPACLHNALTQLGIEPGTTASTPPSFQPKNDGFFSAAAILYIRAAQVKKLTGGNSIQVPVSCKALIGQIVMDAIAAGNKVGGLSGLPGSGVLNALPVLQ